MKLLVYQKFRNSEEDPLDVEIHCWKVKAKTFELALEIAEKSPYVPWRMYLIDKIEESDLDSWVVQNEINQDDVFVHTL